MPILALGISYRRARVELLERLAFTEDDYPKAYARLLDLEGVSEGVILSTCNRVEVFAEVASYHAGFLDLKRFLAESRELHPDEFAEPLYSHYEDDAVSHLFTVAAGLDSMVLGEPQILAQVRQAYRVAESEGGAGASMSRVFRGAIRTGRRVRAETAVGASPGAMVEAGSALAARALGRLAGKSALVVGAGGMAVLAVRDLRSRGVGHLRIVNRSLERANRLASRAGAEAGRLADLVDGIAEADVVVSSTGAAGVVIGGDMVKKALGDGAGRARDLFILDLAVPRDVDPGVRDLPGVSLADIDDLKEMLGEDSGREAALGRAREVVAEEVKRFVSWRRAARLAPLIQALRDRGARIQAAELARVAPRLSDLSDREWAAVQALASGIVAKLLHDPIVRLKERAGVGPDSLARVVADLFGIDVPEGS